MITVQQIIAAVAKEYGVTVEEILEKRRMQTGARSRAAAMWCARKLTKRSFPELDRDFNRDDHTTIMSGCR
ncbi:MAG TPA: helix-turn-helix domain-containing protein, partial [Polyangiaceae bacterium]|nr:helix-turn-helix domain-containing protein [Polyangiaceae bacterium]